MTFVSPRRGATENPAGRFERLHYDEAAEFAQPPAPDEAGPAGPRRTAFFRDPSRRALSWNQSPDLPFDASLNPYRGCEHGCSYCFARPTHEYLGLSAGLDFETKVFVKDELPKLLRHELSSRRWRPQPVTIGGVTDPYQPIERSARITRRCLEVFLEFRNPVSLVTKSALVARDVDLLGELAGGGAAEVCVSVTTLDRELHRALEPRSAAPSQRLAAIERLARAGVPVAVLVAPLIPGLNDHEAPAIIEAAARAGARSARPIMLKLPHGVKEIFASWLERHYPERKAKVLNRVRAMRGGRLHDSRFHERQRGSGLFAEQSAALFAVACRRAGVDAELPPLATTGFRRPGGEQLSLL
ncbi:MAG: PA0069 family radical SAM protein [Deltaproteobacteria bacterium]|nr:PA0069 family radical SAM protein [Deltaproteobacteria bacterium]